jgi:hypothetical protein
MNHIAHHIILLLCTLLSLVCQSQTLRSVEQINVLEKNGNQINIMQLASQDRWVLIILNENLNISQKMLTQLQDKNADMSHTIILIIGNQLQPPIDEKFHQTIAAKAWVKTTSPSVLKQLNLVGTPVILGIKAAEINWQISGFSAASDTNTIINRINSWSNK